MCQGLVKELRPYKNGKPRVKWVRPPGAKPKSDYSIARRASYRRIREVALAAFGDKCVQCGFSDARALQIDHVQGGGSQARKKYRGISYYYHILNTLGKVQYQILCANCNIIKGKG